MSDGEATKGPKQEVVPQLSIGEVLALQRRLREKWGIFGPKDSLDWNLRLQELSAETRVRYRELHDEQAAMISRGKTIPAQIERQWYDFLAAQPISGVVHSQKYPYILDVAAAVIRLWRHHRFDGALLDVGCHVGYHLDLYEQFTSARVVGVEASTAAVQVASEQLGSQPRISIIAGDVMTASLARSKMIVCVDAFPKDSAGLALLLKRLTTYLDSDGLIVLAGDLLSVRKGELARICQFLGLRMRLHEVVGGWVGALGSFENRLLVALGRTGTKVPRDLYLNWDGFPSYANSPTTAWDRKTQAFFNAMQ